MSAVYLVGYTGSPASRRALTFASLLARPTGAGVIAVNAYPVAAPSFSAEAAMLGEAEIEDHAHRASERLLCSVEQEHGVQERRAVPGPAPHALVETAGSTGAGLIAVGATGRGALGRIVPGSIAERLLHCSPCPVAVVPATWGGQLRRIAVAHDDSAESGHALAAARDVAGRHGAEIVLLHVGGPDDGTELVAQEVGARCSLLDGAPGPALVSACCEDIDLLVCGSRSYRPMRAALTNCVSRHVVDHAPCPVLVTPRAAARKRPATAARAATAVATADGAAAAGRTPLAG